jgi:putative transposase
VIQDDEHALVVLRYIEANPLRTGVVKDAGDYRWSSYAVHGLGNPDPLVATLPAWEALGRSEERRRARWTKMVHAPLADKELAALRRSLNSGRPYGSDSWVAKTAANLGLPLSSRPRGRPRKDEKMN